MDPRKELISELSPEQKKAFLAVLFRMARADEVSVAERDRLAPVTAWLETDAALEAAAIQLADSPEASLAELVLPLQDTLARFLLFRESCAVIWVDMRKSTREAALLSELADALALHREIVEVLDSPLACSPEGERRFLELLGGTDLA